MNVLWVALGVLSMAAVAVALILQTRSKKQAASPAEVTAQLRESVFGSDPVKLGIAITPREAWGVVMDTGYPKAVATLVSLADGSASIYFSTGGGMIGGQGQPAVREAAMAFVRSATEHLGELKPVSEHPLPADGRARFYVLTPEGVFSAEASVRELGEKRHGLSPLFYAGQEVITQFRLTSDKEGRQ